MKKTLVALAALSATAGALAQSSVTIYGTLDASVAYVNKSTLAVKNSADKVIGYEAGKSVVLLNDSAITTSRWGMRGTEDLGGGLKANFNLESDVNMGTGANNPAGMFRRSAYVSLASDQYGELRLGRATSVAVGHLVSGGIVAPNNAMHGTVLLGAGLAADFFVANAITYISPSMSGLRASLQYAPGEQAGDSRAGSSAHAAVKYQGSNFTLGGAYVNVEDTSAAANDGRKWYTVDGTVTLGQVKLGAAYYDVNHNPGAVTFNKVDNQGYILNGSYQLDPKVMLFAGFIKSLQDSSAVTLQARYALSKRTTVYAMVNHVDNGAEGVNFNPIYIDIPNGAANAKQTAFATGVIHSF